MTEVKTQVYQKVLVAKIPLPIQLKFNCGEFRHPSMQWPNKKFKKLFTSFSNKTILNPKSKQMRYQEFNWLMIQKTEKMYKQ